MDLAFQQLVRQPGFPRPALGSTGHPSRSRSRPQKPKAPPSLCFVSGLEGRLWDLTQIPSNVTLEMPMKPRPPISSPQTLYASLSEWRPSWEAWLLRSRRFPGAPCASEGCGDLAVHRAASALGPAREPASSASIWFRTPLGGPCNWRVNAISWKMQFIGNFDPI